ncbi:Filamentous growth regulator 27 [Colletotrichum sp. SAR11_239]|nr:Filamentous growth regulator 27 [Colletotrichum sp. SAR11_239]
MFEAQVPLQQPDSFQDDMSDEEKLELIQLFSDASSGLLDLFDKSEIDTLVDATHPREKSVSSSSTGFATDIEGRGFLTDLTLNMARGFVLMAFYMFGACRRNAAFMYLGVATKAASVLGLHMSDQFQSLSQAEQSFRARPSSDRETTIGNIHVACTYYFGIITTTREFLIQHIMPQIDGRVEAGMMTDGCLVSEDNEKTAELAKVCVDAAAYMAEMCSDALDTGVIMGNMCILKWVLPVISGSGKRIMLITIN